MNNNSSTLLRNLAIEYRSTSALKVNPRNVRTHSKRQVQAIAESIKSFGFTNPVLVDDDDIILAGHGRFQAAKLLELDAVPAIRISQLTEAQKRALVLADNKLAERAGWDRELLAVELGELAVMLPDLDLSVDLTGFEVGEIDAILTDVEEDKAASRDDEVIPLPEKPVSRPGDLANATTFRRAALGMDDKGQPLKSKVEALDDPRRDTPDLLAPAGAMDQTSVATAPGKGAVREVK
jgi:ParB-like chromosome segregation protein Spo0J